VDSGNQNVSSFTMNNISLSKNQITLFWVKKGHLGENQKIDLVENKFGKIWIYSDKLKKGIVISKKNKVDSGSMVIDQSHY